MTEYTISDLSNTVGFIYNPDTNTLSLTQDINWDGADNIKLNSGETFDGKGHTIDLDNTATNGLFTSKFDISDNILENYSNIKNIKIINGKLSNYKESITLDSDTTTIDYGPSYILKPKSSYANIYNCIINDTNDTLNIKDCGSIIGSNNNYINVYNCISNINIGDTQNINNNGIGGIGGSNNTNICIYSCYTTGNIYSNDSGGIIGSNFGNNSSFGIIYNCYTTGNIEGNDSGGITGNNSGSGDIRIFLRGFVLIQNCYSTGIITGSNSGGITGNNTANTALGKCVIQNCYSKGITINSEKIEIINNNSFSNGNYSILLLNDKSIHEILDSSLNKISTYIHNSITYTNNGNAFTRIDNNYPVLKNFLNTPWIDTEYSTYTSSPNFIKSSTELNNTTYDISNIPYGILLDDATKYLDVSIDNLNLESTWTIECIFRPLLNNSDSTIFELTNSYSLTYNGTTKKIILGSLVLGSLELDVPQDNKFHHYVFTSSGNCYIDYIDNSYNLTSISLTQSNIQNFKIGGSTSSIELLNLRIWSEVKTIETIFNYSYNEVPLDEINENLRFNCTFTNRNRIYKTYFDNSIYQNHLTYSNDISLRIPQVYELNFSETTDKNSDLYITDLSYNNNGEHRPLNFYFINKSGYTLQTNEDISMSIPYNYNTTNKLYSSIHNYTVNESYYDISFQYYTTNGFYVSDLATVNLHFDYLPVWENNDSSYNFVFAEDDYYNNYFTLYLDYDYINIDLSNQYDISLIVTDKIVVETNNTDDVGYFNNADELFDIIVEDYENVINGFTNENDSKLNKKLRFKTKEQHFYGKVSFNIKAFNIRNPDLSANKTFTIEFTSVNDPIEWNTGQFGTSDTRVNFDEFTTKTLTITKYDLIDADLSFNPERFEDLSFVLYDLSGTKFTSDIVSSNVTGINYGPLNINDKSEDISYIQVSFTGKKDQIGTVDGYINVFDTTQTNFSSNIPFYLNVVDANEEFTYADYDLNTILTNESLRFFYNSRLTIDISSLIQDSETYDENIDVKIINNYPNILNITYDNTTQQLDISSIITDEQLYNIIFVEQLKEILTKEQITKEQIIKDILTEKILSDILIRTNFNDLTQEQIDYIFSVDKLKNILSDNQIRYIIVRQQLNNIIENDNSLNEILNSQQIDSSFNIEQLSNLLTIEQLNKILTIEELTGINLPIKQLKDILTEEQFKNILTNQQLKDILTEDQLKNILTPYIINTTILPIDELVNNISLNQLKNVLTKEQLKNEITEAQITNIINQEQISNIINLKILEDDLSLEELVNILTNKKINYDMSFVLIISDRYENSQDGALANTREFTHNITMNRYLLQNIIKYIPLRQYVNNFFSDYIEYDVENRTYNIKKNFNVRDLLHKYDVPNIDDNTQPLYRFIIERGDSINGNLNTIDLSSYGTDKSLFSMYERNVIDTKVNRHYYNYDILDISNILNISNLGIVSDNEIDGCLLDSSVTKVSFDTCYGRGCGSFVNNDNNSLYISFNKCNLINNSNYEFIGNNKTNNTYILSKITKLENDTKKIIMYDEVGNEYRITKN
jgi:hypothetical protein